MPYIPHEIIDLSRQIDLLTYLQIYEPDELILLSGNTYCTRTHDSLKISNGKWYWFSRGIGGHTAMDYLIKVKGVPFAEAVELLAGNTIAMMLDRREGAIAQPVIDRNKSITKPVTVDRSEKVLLLPQVNTNSTRVISYLRSRGIDQEIIKYCLETNRLYESYPHHNAVFIGKDNSETPRYANLRGTCSDFKGEANGSDKRYSFSIPAAETKKTTTLHLFESSIDLLSYATLQKLSGRDWQKDHLLSLAGIYRPRSNTKDTPLPLALKQFIQDYGPIKTIFLRLDNDTTGRLMMNTLYTILSDQYEVVIIPPSRGKDYNDLLCYQLGLKSLSGIQEGEKTDSRQR